MHLSGFVDERSVYAIRKSHRLNGKKYWSECSFMLRPFALGTEAISVPTRWKNVWKTETRYRSQQDKYE